MGLSSQPLCFLGPIVDVTPSFLLFALFPFPPVTSWLNNGAASLFESLGGSVRDVIRLVCSGQRCQRGVGGQREPCLQTVCVYIPDGERQL